MTLDVYRVNDALGALANEAGTTLPDDTLNELTHHVHGVLTGTLPTAQRWMTERVGMLFDEEIANEHNGGITPSTLSSCIDSVSQAPDILCDGWETGDWVALLAIRDLCDGNTELADLL
jgi:hypothetical protein